MRRGMRIILVRHRHGRSGVFGVYLGVREVGCLALVGLALGFAWRWFGSGD